MSRLFRDDDVIVNLARRRLDAWPPGLDALQRVEQLTVQDNALTTVPPWLGRFPHLHSLDLSRNPIDAVPEGVVAELSGLRHLEVGYTRLRRLPEALADLELRSLGLQSLPDLDWDHTLALLARIPTLTKLNLGENALEAVPEGLFALTGLRLLYLHRCALAELSPRIAELRELEVLSLQHNALRALPGSIASLPKLVSLVISRNPGIRKMKAQVVELGMNVQLS